MKIAIAGGTGFVGRALTEALLRQGHEVTVLTRAGSRNRVVSEATHLAEYEPTKPGPWQQAIANSEATINLAGTSIFRRWSPRAKRDIVDSRVLPTTHIVEALTCREHGEAHLLNVSGIGYYGFGGDDILDETSLYGSDFLARVALQWESAAISAGESGVRVVLCRLGHVLGPGGGALRKLATLTRLHLGSQWGDGRQWLSWVHHRDMTDMFLFLLEHKELKGAFNLTAPNPARNEEMLTALGRSLGKTAYVPPIPAFLLRLLLGEFATVFLNGQRIRPTRMLDSGFRFSYSRLDEALEDILKRSN